MKEHTCNSFWINDKKDSELKAAIDSFRKKNGRKIGIAEIVMPSIDAFIASELKGKEKSNGEKKRR